MYLGLLVLVLLYHAVSADANCTVEGCSSDFCVENKCTKCNDRYYLSGDLCNQCYLHCRFCDNSVCYRCINNKCIHTCQSANCSSCDIAHNVLCIGCPDGFFLLGGSCYPCLQTGCRCSLLSNCTSCLPGRYDVASRCADTCPSDCVTCFSANNCSECETGKYGPVCEYDCISECQNGICDKDSGNCPSVCSDNWYLDSNKVCRKCPNRCSNCTNFSKCTSCKNEYYWGKKCEYDCTGCYHDCNKETGCSSNCHGPYFYRYNKGKGGYECVLCPDNCLACTNSTECATCKPNYWGAYCQHKCPVNCTNQNCDKSNGTCSEGCIDGLTGPQCNQKCPVNCFKCGQFNISICDTCEIGFYGDSCNNRCNINCYLSNGKPSCIKSNGSCILGCKYGYWGSKCDNECSMFCANSSEVLRLCDETNGRCHNGCVDGRYGEHCKLNCSKNCKGRTCFQQNGTCKEGSVAINSTVKVSTKGPDGALPPTSEGSIALPLGAGAGGAVVVVVLVIVLVVFVRQRTTNKGQQKDRLSPETASNNLGKEENTYATITDPKSAAYIIPEEVLLSEVPSPITNDEFKTAEPNNAILGKDEMEAPENMSENGSISDGLVDINLETKNAHSSNKINKGKGPHVQRNEKGNETENGIPDTDSNEQLTDNLEEEGNTYYNTVGKRVQVSYLTEYIRSRDQYMLVEEFNKLPRGLLKDYNAAKHQRNASKNRYKMIYPYDETRVILKDGANDYVNASYIQGYNKPKEYIGSAGPFQRGTNDNGTEVDFWRMVWQEKCETIVMLTKCFENKEHKCVQYWPELGQSKEYAKSNVSCVTEDQYADFTIRSFVVSRDGQTLNSRHLHFTAWPDKGVPADVTSMIEYRQKVRSLHKNAKSPMLVHCSAGIGRTGTFIALDMLTFMGEARGYVDMFGCVANLRFHRTSLVQTPEQYEYLHHAILHALTFDCKSITGEKFIETYSQLIKKKDGKSQLETQFQKLQSTIDEMSVEDKAAVNRNKTLVDKNREGADIPGDENRVRLFENRKASASDYINALFINGFRSRNKFIAAQTPLPATVVDFLSLIFQVKCSCVVMMEETDLQDKTVGVYWPADNQVIKHGVFQVACKESKTTSSYTVKTLSVKRKVGKKEEEQDVSLFIYTNWPKDAAVPKSSDSLIQLVKDVDTKNNRQDDEKPILIHCMTGAERSCLYCAVSVLIEKMEIEHEVSVVNTLRQIKARRRSAIPTLDQYKFCHQAVISYIQTFDIYSNFGLKSK